MTDPTSPRARFLSGTLAKVLLIAAVTALAYASSLKGPFIFDDIDDIPGNPSIRTLTPLSVSLSPPRGIGLAGRPLVNLSFAVNYFFGKTEVTGYHLANIAIHIACALTLLGCARRLLPLFGLTHAERLALAGSLLFALHPVATEAVSYIIQRCESLMALFFLFAVYAFLRSREAGRSALWQAASAASCMAGVFVKEVIVMAPVLIWLLDKVYLTPRGTPVRRGAPLAYWGYFLSYCLMLWHLAGGGTASSGTSAYSFAPWEYVASQPEVILTYLRLIVWPVGLVLDYGYKPFPLATTWPAILAVAGLLALTGWGLWKKRPFAYALAWFFAILAPTSLLPLPDLAFEHRIYLAQAGPLLLAVSLLDAGLTRLGRGLCSDPKMAEAAGASLFRVTVLAASALAATATIYRNLDYRYEFRIFSDNVAKRPDNARAWASLSAAWLAVDQPAKAIDAAENSLRLAPGVGGTLWNIGVALERLKRPAEALEYYRTVAMGDPRNVSAVLDLGSFYGRQGEYRAAVAVLEAALRLDPGNVKTLVNLGAAHSGLGRLAEAAAYYQKALTVDPDYAPAHLNIGGLDLTRGDMDAAVARFARAIAADPGLGGVFLEYGRRELIAGKPERAAFYFDLHLRVKPGDAQTASVLARISADLDAAGKTPVNPYLGLGGWISP